MITSRQLKIVALVAFGVAVGMVTTATAAQCGSTAAGFEAWKRQFADEARAWGVSASAVAALMNANYATATIAADRSQRSFRLSREGVRSGSLRRRFLLLLSSALASRRGRS